MRIGVIKELIPYENRVAITPNLLSKFGAINFKVIVEKDAGLKAGFSNESYIQNGATLGSREEIFKQADIIVSVNALAQEDLKYLSDNKILVGTYMVSNNQDLMESLKNKKIELLSLELMPRISRAQAMDVLSSQNNLAGYKSVLIGANYFKKAIPLMMTAAGMIPPAKVFVMGAGVAGLQAIATAKRLGAVVTAYDVRAATKEQVESLGGKFIVVDETIFKNSESSGGYAKELPEDYQEKEKEVIFNHITKQDIVITTALIPGKKAPLLVTEKMVQNMIPGSIIVDLAAINGGNCELTEFNKVVEKHNVTIIGHANLVSDIANSASDLYANNLLNLFKSFYKKDMAFNFNYEDDIIKAILVINNRINK